MFESNQNLFYIQFGVICFYGSRRRTLIYYGTEGVTCFSQNGSSSQPGLPVIGALLEHHSI